MKDVAGGQRVDRLDPWRRDMAHAAGGTVVPPASRRAARHRDKGIGAAGECRRRRFPDPAPGRRQCAPPTPRRRCAMPAATGAPAPPAARCRRRVSPGGRWRAPQPGPVRRHPASAHRPGTASNAERSASGQRLGIGLCPSVVERHDDALAMGVDQDRGQRRARAVDAPDKAAIDAFGFDPGDQLIADEVVSCARPERYLGAEAACGAGCARRHARGDLDTVGGDELALMDGKRLDAKDRIERQRADAQERNGSVHEAALFNRLDLAQRDEAERGLALDDLQRHRRLVAEQSQSGKALFDLHSSAREWPCRGLPPRLSGP